VADRYSTHKEYSHNVLSNFADEVTEDKDKQNELPQFLTE